MSRSVTSHKQATTLGLKNFTVKQKKTETICKMKNKCTSALSDKLKRRPTLRKTILQLGTVRFRIPLALL